MEEKKKNTTVKKNAVKKSATKNNNTETTKSSKVEKAPAKRNNKNVVKEEKSEVKVKETIPVKDVKKPTNTKNKKMKIEEPKKMKKLQTEENIIVKRFIVVLFIVIIGVVIIYFFTRAFISKDLFNNSKKDNNTTEVSFDYDKTILGSTFNRPYSEYYVIIYKSSSEQASNLSSIMASYKYSENATKIYFADLDDFMNQGFYDTENVNKNATKASELKVGDYTLIKIKNGAIEKYIEGVEAIETELKVD